MAKEAKSIPYETNAELRTVEGWCCKTCGKYWGKGESGERAAKYCCCTDRLCERCGKARTRDRHYLNCAGCEALRDAERFDALEKKPYDGTAVVVWNDDRYLFDEGELRDWLSEIEIDDRSEVRLVFAECKKPGWGRSVSELLVDELYDDAEFDTREIDKQIEEWVAEHAPDVYWPTNVAVAPESIAELFRQIDAENEA